MNRLGGSFLFNASSGAFTKADRVWRTVAENLTATVRATDGVGATADALVTIVVDSALS